MTEPQNAETREAEWEQSYADAVRWRDWQTCEILLDEREQADWYAPDVLRIEQEDE